MSRKRQKTTHGTFTASNGDSYTRPPPLTLQDAMSEFSEALEVAAKLGEGLMIELLMGWAEELRLKWAYMRDSRSLDKSPDQANGRQNGFRDVRHHDHSDDAMRDDGDETVSENEEENDELYEQYLEGENNKFLHTATFKSFNIPVHTAEGLGYLLPRNKKAYDLGLTPEQIRAQAIELRDNVNVENMVAGTWNNRRWTGLAIACNGLEYRGDQQCIRCSSGAGPFKKCTYWEGNSRYRCSNCAWDNERCAWPQLMKKTRPKKFSISTSGKTSHSGPSTDATISVNDDATISVHGGRSEADDEETGPADNFRVQEQLLDYEPMDVEPLGHGPVENAVLGAQVTENAADPIEQAEKAFKKLPTAGTPFHTALGELFPTTLEEFQDGLTLEEMTELGIVLNFENWPPGYVWKDAAWRALAIALEGDVMEGEDACDICKSGKGRFAECYVWKQQTSRCASCTIRKKMCKEPFVPKDQRPSAEDNRTSETTSTRRSNSAQDSGLIQGAEYAHEPESIQRPVTAQKPQVVEKSLPVYESVPVHKSMPVEEADPHLSNDFDESGGSELEPEQMQLDNADFSNKTMSPAGNTPAQASPHFTMLDKYLDPYDVEGMDQYVSPEDALMDQEEDIEEAAPVFNTAYTSLNTEEIDDVSVPVSPGQRNTDDNTPDRVSRLVSPSDASVSQGHMNKTGQSNTASNTPIDLPFVRLGDIEDEESEYDEYSDSGDEIEPAVGNGIGSELIRHLTASLSGSTTSSHVNSPEQVQFPLGPWAPPSDHSHLPELLEMEHEPKRQERKVQRPEGKSQPQEVVRKPLGRPRKDRQKERQKQGQDPNERPKRQHPRRERRVSQKVAPKLAQLQKEQPPKPAAPAIKITTRVKPSLIISFKYNPHAFKLLAKPTVKPPTKQTRVAPTKGAFTSSIERHKITTSAPFTAKPSNPVPKLPQLKIPLPIVPPTAPPKKPFKATFSTNPTDLNGTASASNALPKKPVGRPPKKNKFHGRRPGAPIPPNNPNPPTRVAPPAPGPINAANSRRIAVPAPTTTTTTTTTTTATQPAAPRKVAPPAPPPLIIPQSSTSNDPIVIKSSPIEPSPVAAPDSTFPQGPTHIPISQMLAEGISLRSSAFTPADALEWCPQKWRAYKIAKHGTYKTGEYACLRCQSGAGRFGKCYFWDGKYQACSTCSWQKASCVFALGHAPGG